MLNIINKNKIIFPLYNFSFSHNNSLLIKNFIHSSAILYSNVRDSILLDAINRLNQERVSDLQLIKYEEKAVEDLKIDLGISTLSESFPWLYDEQGKQIEFNKPIKLFDGVKLISNFLEKRFDADPNLLSDVKIGELLKPFSENKEITVLELFNHVSNLYKEDQGKLLKKLTFESEAFSDTIITNNSSKPFGEYGDVTLNQIGVALKEKMNDIKWDFVSDATQVTVHGLPLAVNAISYGLVLRAFIKYVHNRPMAPNLNASQLALTRSVRDKQLLIFSILGVPITLLFLKYSSLGLKDVFTLSSPSLDKGGGESGGPLQLGQLENNNKTINTNSSLFLLLSNLNKKIPSWLKIVFRLLFSIILTLKLLGFSII